MENMLTISDLALRSGVAEQTLRRWLKQFSPFFPCREFGRQRKYPASTLKTIHYINEQFRAGEGTAAILASLQEGCPPHDTPPPKDATAASPPLFPSPELTERLTRALEALAQRDQELDLLRQSIDNLTQQVTLLRESGSRNQAAFLKADFRRQPLKRDVREDTQRFPKPILPTAPPVANTSEPPPSTPIPQHDAIIKSPILTAAAADFPSFDDRHPAQPANHSPAETPPIGKRPTETERIQRASEISKKTLECLIQTNADIEFLSGQPSPWWRRLFHK